MDTKRFRAWAEIDLDALLYNHRATVKRLGEKTGVCAVVKADAYGHGAVRIAQLLENEVRYFAVAMAEEAFELRKAGIKAPIMILGLIPDEQILPLINEGITMTLATKEEGEKILSFAKKAGKKARVHLAVDSGMGRIGFFPNEDSARVIAELYGNEEMEIEGIFSHFASADEEDLSFALEQQKRFDGFVSLLEEYNVHIPLVHLFNSSAICNLEGKEGYGMAREGLVLYGLSPSPFVNTEALGGLRPAMTLKSRIVQIKTVPAGTPLSYGSTFVTDRETKVATVSVGYGDGVPRLLSNCGEMLVKGRCVPIIGRVCMDQLMLDVSGIEELEVGNEVILFGTDGSNYIDCGEQMEKCGSINYELLCNINRRVPRVYLMNGQIESIANILPEDV